MLKITRKDREWFLIMLPDGRQIRVLIDGVRGDRAKIGIEAPADVQVIRPELVGASPLWENRDNVDPERLSEFASQRSCPSVWTPLRQYIASTAEVHHT